MSNVIGEPLGGYVIEQINARQKLHGSGGREGTRTDTQINLLNSNTSWVKLASGVYISEKRLQDTDIPSSFSGMNLAKDYVLNSGISKLGVSEYDKPKLIQREGFLPQNPNSSYSYGSYGYSPMPGIVSADIKTLNRGSLKKATVRLLANNRQQFDIIDLLYLRLGYTVLLEWGNSMYTPDGTTKEIVRNTLIEDLFFSKSANGSYLDMLKPIEQRRAKYNGNYDGLLGKVSNFSWTFKEDGSYEIELTIISLGDVIESLKTNISVDKNTNEFLKNTTGTPLSPNEQPAEPDPIEENKDANTITSMLYIWKYLNNSPDSIGNEINIITDNGEHIVGGFLSNTQKGSESTISSVLYEYEFFIEGERAFESSRGVTYEPVFETRKQRYTKEQISNKEPDTYAQQLYKDYKANDPGITSLKVPYKRLTKSSGNTVTIDNPIKDAPQKSAFAFKTLPKPQYYLRFGYLLEYIKDNILLKIKVGEDHDLNPPIFDIDSAIWSNHMYSLPNQISLDPRICIVRNDKFNNGQTKTPTKIFSQLDIFKEIDNGNSQNDNAAYVMNIYLNFNFIIECLKTDERGDVNVFEFIKSICDGLNRALGGINNLEPIIEETSNTLKIIDTTPIPGYSGIDGTRKYTLQLYGYNKLGTSYISNFIRKVDLKTAITPEFATMVTVGATAGGYVKGVEATAFSRWNYGLTDRFKEEFTPGNPASVTPTGSADEAEINYFEKFLKGGYVNRYGFTSFTGESFKLSDDIIEGNISVGTEYFKYIVAKSKSTSGGTIGFIPFKISFTMDGLSGIKIYNKLNVDTRFLPRAYGNNLDLIVTGVSHKLANNDWETDIEATVIPKTKLGNSGTITSQIIQQSIEEVKSAPINIGEPPPDYKPLSSDDDLWVYLSWQQGVGGASQHYKVSTGKMKKYGIKADAIKSNWPGKKVASNGVKKQDIDSLYTSNPKKLAIGFIDVWRQHYKEKTSRAITLINSTGKNRSGVLYSDIKKTFQKYAIPNKGLTWEKLARFGLIENSLNTDDETATTFQGMFQINKTYKKNPDNVTILTNSNKGKGHKPTYTEYDLDKYIGPLAIRIAQKLEEFKRNSGYPN